LPVEIKVVGIGRIAVFAAPYLQAGLRVAGKHRDRVGARAGSVHIVGAVERGAGVTPARHGDGASHGPTPDPLLVWSEVQRVLDEMSVGEEVLQPRFGQR